ncbi:MAG: Uma2 family endonuclease [Thermomicrobiales bacterium]
MQTKTEATIEDLYNAPDDGIYEIVYGRLVKLMSTGDDPNFTAGEIFASLREYAHVHPEGRARTDGVAYVVDLPNRKSFSPDASFSYTRSGMRFVNGAPLFAAEVRSEHDHGPAADREYARKRRDYFAAGTEVVWGVDPESQTVRSFRREAPTAPIVFQMGDMADAEPALPGWRLSVDDLFNYG